MGQILNVITETLGAVSCGDAQAPGGCTVKLVVPAKAAAAIIGVGGQTVKNIKAHCGVRVSIDMNKFPCADGVSEQGILLGGSAEGVCAAIPAVLDQVAILASERGLDAYA